MRALPEFSGPIPIKTPASSKVPTRADLLAGEQEILDASLSPKCYIENHTYADVGVMAAPGGTGKTTIILYEMISLALGKSLYGLNIECRAWSLFVTAEDQRERLLARIREICYAMQLSETETEIVRQSVLIWDVTGDAMKLTHCMDEAIEVAAIVDKIIDVHREDPPGLITFDPLVSFGVSEQRINDNEQGLITAARRIVKALDCCVRLVHHTGKGNASSSALGQYSARGGSALADGARMMTVLQRYEPSESGGPQPPPECLIDPESSITIYARPKISHAPPNQPLIFLKRTGFLFESFVSQPVSDKEDIVLKAARVLRFIDHELNEGNFYNHRQLNACCRKMNLSQAKLRPAVSDLEARGKVVSIPRPRSQNPSGRATFLCPSIRVDEFSEDGENG